MNLQRARLGGFTLIELLVTISIAAILMLVAVPSFRDFQRNAELTSTINSLMAAVNAARGEAMKRGAFAYVVPTDGSSWSSGLTVFVDKNLDQSFTSGTDDIVLTVPASSSYITLTGTGTAAGSSPYISYDGSGYAKTKTGSFGALTLTIARNDVGSTQLDAQTRRLVVAATGRTRTCRPDQDTTCTASATQ
ncbi:GspH/FimT family pseudopilin [Ottowia sp.]|uniref:GspH/FimT family pseudopilin n=1 Tax=Ottowia sp. TaxID=1898956 RepID=UPI002613723C|nr:GspH/FimT family pseudopilin [Ottowia sp.]